MKTQWGSIQILGIVGLGLLAGACSGSGSAGQNDDPQARGVVSELRSDAARVTPDIAEAASAAKSEQTFAFEFLHALPEHENTTFSPHSISAAFAMATDAAAGDTLTEVEQVLGFGKADEAFHRSQDALKLGLAARNRDALNTEERQVDAQILTESNDIWIRDDSPPQPSYLDTLARYYGAGVHQADFGNQPNEARLAINAKVSSDTRELIPELLPKGIPTPETVAVLTNALYFKAPWAARFAEPVPGDFHALDGSTVEAKMLRREADLRYYEGEGFAAVDVPYYGNELSMLLIVPDAGKYQSVRTTLSGELLTQVVAGLQSQLIDLKLPKFELKSNVPAKKTLEALGMATPFDPYKAAFPKLESPLFENIYVSDVLHQATVAIDEKGTEASAATAIIFSGVSANPEPTQPKVVTVDRPFLFVIRDNPTGSVLFVGQVVSP
jgi:serpin B